MVVGGGEVGVGVVGAFGHAPAKDVHAIGVFELFQEVSVT